MSAVSSACAWCGIGPGAHRSNCPVLSQEIKVPLTFDSIVKAQRDWKADEREQVRAERHHEVYLAVLRELYSATSKDAPLEKRWPMPDTCHAYHSCAKYAADLAYPPEES